MATRRLTRELIDKRIESLFGDIGGKEGQYYFDTCYCAVCQVTNKSGAVRILLNASSPSRLLEKLDSIETYLYYIKNYKRNISNELRMQNI